MPQYDGRYDREMKMFTDAMKTKLAANQHKGKWEGVNLEELLQRIVDEVDELRQAIKGGNAIEIMLEAADIANFAMMAADVAVRQAVAPTPPYPGPRVRDLPLETREEKLDRLVPRGAASRVGPMGDILNDVLPRGEPVGRTVAIDQFGGKTTQIGNFQIIDAERPD